MKTSQRKDNRKAKSLLKLHDIQYPQIAARAGVSPTTVSVVLGGHGPSANIRRTITRMLRAKDRSLTDRDIWGDEAGGKSRAA